MSKDLEVPEEEFEDYAHAAIKSAIGVIPIAGGVLQEFFSSVFESPLSKRKIEWMRKVVEAIQELQERGLKVDELRDNEQFISAVFYASHLAMKTHQEEKLQALKNAIINVAEGTQQDENLQQIFFNYVDQFTPLHIQILNFAINPIVPRGTFMSSFSICLYKAYPDLNRKSEVVNQVWRELYNCGFVNTQHMEASILSGVRESHASEIGVKFINFIGSHS